MSRRELILNAFEMNTIGHIAHGLWRHPRDRSTQYSSLDYWLDLARTLEAGLFDGIFIADVNGLYDVYKGGPETALRHAVQAPVNDPSLVIPAMASVTRHLGFGVTLNTGSEQPYALARRLSTLDHLTQGRIGWNIVTGFLDSAARGLGQPAQFPHDDRYDRGDEFMTLVYRLWQESWEDGAVLADREQGLYADPRRIHAIRHEGRYYNLDAIHLCAPSPQRTPVLFQAGASARGRRFAARHAEAIFVPNQGRVRTAAIVRDLRRLATEAGRDPASIRILVGLQVIVGEIESEAVARFAEYRRFALPEAGLAQYSASTGVDFSRFGLDDPIPQLASNGIRSATDALNQRGAVTVRQLLAEMPLGGRYPAVVGSPSQIADEMEAWVQEADVDGFNLVRTVTPECFRDFADLVVPELQARGLFKRAYAAGTLREKLFASGPHLRSDHPARKTASLEIAP